MRSGDKRQNYSYGHKAISKPEHSLAKWKNVKANTKSLKQCLDFSATIGWNNSSFNHGYLNRVIPISRDIITIVIHQGIRPRIDSETIAVPIIALSAIGSRNLPNSVMVFRLRARFPSKISLSPKTKNIHQEIICHVGSSPPFLNNA